MKTLSRKARGYLLAAGIAFSILVADILAAKIQVMNGVIDPVHIGDTGQFLVLLAVVILFVIGAILREKVVDGEKFAQYGQKAANEDQTVNKPENLATNETLERGETSNAKKDPQ